MESIISALLGVGENPNETVNISLIQVGGSSTDLIGAAITITDDDTGDTLLTATWNGSTITTEIDVNTNYTVSVENITGYTHPSSVSYQAGYQTERNITFNYALMGIYIEATDHTLYTSSTWASSGKTANSIVIITDAHSFRISLVHNIDITHLPSGDYSAFSTFETVEAARLDFNGKENTQLLLAVNSSITRPAGWCTNYTFPDGITKGYMGSYGQWEIVYNNKATVDACISACNAPALVDYWTSTPGPIKDNAKTFYFHWVKTNGYAISVGDSGPSYSYCRVIADYEI